MWWQPTTGENVSHDGVIPYTYSTIIKFYCSHFTIHPEQRDGVNPSFILKYRLVSVVSTSS